MNFVITSKFLVAIMSLYLEDSGKKINITFFNIETVVALRVVAFKLH